MAFSQKTPKFLLVAIFLMSFINLIASQEDCNQDGEPCTEGSCCNPESHCFVNEAIGVTFCTSGSGEEDCAGDGMDCSAGLACCNPDSACRDDGGPAHCVPGAGDAK